jgi:hypothetical protein
MLEVKQHYEQHYNLFFLLNVIRTIISKDVMNKLPATNKLILNSDVTECNKLVMNTYMLPLTSIHCSCYVEDVLYVINVAQYKDSWWV